MEYVKLRIVKMFGLESISLKSLRMMYLTLLLEILLLFLINWVVEMLMQEKLVKLESKLKIVFLILSLIRESKIVPTSLNLFSFLQVMNVKIRGKSLNALG